jgi:transposase InsO family protein
MDRICSNFGKTRQGFYKDLKARISDAFQEAIVIKAVQEIRKSQPRVGGRKLQKMLLLMGSEISRDGLFDILREKNLLVRVRRNYRRTTNSSHRFRKYSNLIKGLSITSPNQVFVSDITYLDTVEGFCYLALVTDLYSRKIVGWDVCKSLSIEGCQRALRMALKGVEDPKELIHHSDRGFQYCNPRYIQILESLNSKVSMTEECHVYENAVAERMNGILKNEFLLGEKLQSLAHAQALTAQAVQTYNHQRLHTSIGYKTPQEQYVS